MSRDRANRTIAEQNPPLHASNIPMSWCLMPTDLSGTGLGHRLAGWDGVSYVRLSSGKVLQRDSSQQAEAKTRSE
jgi:hypothetical protein